MDDAPTQPAPYTLPGPLALSRSSVDRVSQLRGDTAWLTQVWRDPSTRVLVVADGQVAVVGDELAFVAPEDAPEGERYLLGIDDGVVFAAVHATGAFEGVDGERQRPSAPLSGASSSPMHADAGVGAEHGRRDGSAERHHVESTPGLREVGAGQRPSGDSGEPQEAKPRSEPQGLSLRDVGAALGDRDAGLAVHAISLANWHATHGHCPRCGAPTVVTEAGHVRRCERDGSEHYPRVDPAVIMLVVDENDRCLLGRQRKWAERRYSTLAGFVEPGETPERAVAREVREEVGIRVDSCRYAGAQPWPFPSSLMLAYFASAPGEEPRPDGDEIADACWFSRAELEAAVASGDVRLPPPVSVARQLVEGWFGGPLRSASSR